MTGEIPEIIQIIPATGWYAVYKHKDENGKPVKWAIACWALVKDDEGNHVRGLIGGDYLDFAEADDGFNLYLHESELP